MHVVVEQIACMPEVAFDLMADIRNESRSSRRRSRRSASGAPAPEVLTSVPRPTSWEDLQRATSATGRGFVTSPKRWSGVGLRLVAREDELDCSRSGSEQAQRIRLWNGQVGVRVVERLERVLGADTELQLDACPDLG